MVYAGGVKMEDSIGVPFSAILAKDQVNLILLFLRSKD